MTLSVPPEPLDPPDATMTYVLMTSTLTLSPRSTGVLPRLGAMVLAGQEICSGKGFEPILLLDSLQPCPLPSHPSPTPSHPLYSPPISSLPLGSPRFSSLPFHKSCGRGVKAKMGFCGSRLGLLWLNLWRPFAYCQTFALTTLQQGQHKTKITKVLVDQVTSLVNHIFWYILSQALEDNIKNFSIRFESLQLVQVINLDSRVSKFHGFIHDTCIFISMFDCISFNFIPRISSVVDTLAKKVSYELVSI
ncbi:hypothetical protein AALP_AAs63807U000400 [Arabis alpina]|uniref:Uncharacterized protein n=1 Tax=Arabis alpina TaxID=50452 RepID=A0A087G1D1_ARAAL|nr:hypothetical protein AALP_AAs63807U000400 [Arabis alpina]